MSLSDAVDWLVASWPVRSNTADQPLTAGTDARRLSRHNGSDEWICSTNDDQSTGRRTGLREGIVIETDSERERERETDRHATVLRDLRAINQRIFRYCSFRAAILSWRLFKWLILDLESRSRPRHAVHIGHSTRSSVPRYGGNGRPNRTPRNNYILHVMHINVNSVVI